MTKGKRSQFFERLLHRSLFRKKSASDVKPKLDANGGVLDVAAQPAFAIGALSPLTEQAIEKDVNSPKPPSEIVRCSQSERLVPPRPSAALEFQQESPGECASEPSSARPSTVSEVESAELPTARPARKSWLDQSFLTILGPLEDDLEVEAQRDEELDLRLKFAIRDPPPLLPPLPPSTPLV
ncbi:hypothetical protein DXG03_009624 [Asterophora parasitica]|uniref:Uncharacterized protein n=1 Tax=Asterophora parasitica TaxID=117018 RepID=A0A9P7KDF2_9AGAR|nr:hypothetical protein DXG03_009624 [Asterophora parasitica]